MRLPAISASKMTGARWVATFLAPSFLTVRRAASSPTASGESNLANFRCTAYQESRCMAPVSGSVATGDAAMEKLEL